MYATTMEITGYLVQSKNAFRRITVKYTKVILVHKRVYN